MIRTITFDDALWQVVPKSRSYETRSKQIIAFNTEFGDLDDKLEAAHQELLSAAPQALITTLPAFDNPLTERKAQSVIERGYNVTGYTLTDTDGRKCIVDMSAVRWFDDAADFAKVMHPQPPITTPPAVEHAKSMEPA